MRDGACTALETLALRTGESEFLSWPTPRSSPNENRTTKPTPSQEMGRHGLYLAGEVNRHEPDAPYRQGEGGNLNPVWVGCLMGFPMGWTDVGPQA